MRVVHVSLLVLISVSFAMQAALADPPSHAGKWKKGNKGVVNTGMPPVAPARVKKAPPGQTNRYLHGKPLKKAPPGQTKRLLTGPKAKNVPPGQTTRYLKGKPGKNIPPGQIKRNTKGGSGLLTGSPGKAKFKNKGKFKGKSKFKNKGKFKH